MQFTSGQAATIKTWLTNNAAGLSDQAAANLLNAPFSPTYWVWKTSTSILDIYATQDDVSAGVGGFWNWANYIAQTAIQQDGWKQMFIVGQTCNLSLTNYRQAVQSIFGGTSPGNAQRDHVFAIARRATTVLEQMFAVAVVSPPANTGNDGVAGNRGKTTNPDLLGTDANGVPLQGNITAQQVAEIRG